LFGLGSFVDHPCGAGPFLSHTSHMGCGLLPGWRHVIYSSCAWILGLVCNLKVNLTGRISKQRKMSQIFLKKHEFRVLIFFELHYKHPRRTHARKCYS
jgi:hypothetical protein